jgi:enoyl-CoA hydratase
MTTPSSGLSSLDPHDLTVAVQDRVVVLTLDRAGARNALNARLRAELHAALLAADTDDSVDVVVLTGADPAFCAGVDLRELADREPGRAELTPCPIPPMTKPLIGAVNGAAVAGGFELALNCSFLIASERARFADTHVRVGVMPAWGLSVLLSQAVGVRRARQLSLTGAFLDATEALRLGLVNAVVEHEGLLDAALTVARAISKSDQRAVAAMLALYDRVAATTAAEGLAIETAVALDWRERSFDPGRLDEQGRRRITELGRGDAHAG